MKILLLFFFVSTPVFADGENRAMRILLQKEVDDFIGNNYNEANSNNPVLPEKAIFEKGSCILFKREGESFWAQKETQNFYIEDIGVKSLKVKPIELAEGKWFLNDARTLPFGAQIGFIPTICPDRSKEMTPEEIFNYKEKNKR